MEAGKHPRFDEVSAGTFRQELFDRSYGFLDEKRDQEITKLKKAVSKERRKRKGRDRPVGYPLNWNRRQLVGRL